MTSYSAARCPTSILAYLIWAGTVSGALINRTIDDQKGDSVTGVTPLFFPGGGIWNAGQTCTTCAIHAGGKPIDTEHVFDGTWYDATYHGTTGEQELVIQVNFTGQAVYVYHIVLNALIDGIITTTDLGFYLDGEHVGAYTHQPGNGTNPAVLYQVPVYTNDSLTQGEHMLQITTSGTIPALVLFDYIEYTTADDSTHSASSGKSSVSVGAIVGGAVGGAVLLSIVCFLYVRYRSRKTRHRRNASATPSETRFLDEGSAADMNHHSPRAPTSPGLTITPYYYLPAQNGWQHELVDLTQPAGPPHGTDSKSSLRLQPGAAQTERSAHLAQQIQALQAQVDELRRTGNSDTQGSASVVTVSDSDQSKLAQRSHRSSRVAEEHLLAALAGLRTEMAALRTELGEQRSEDAPPSYVG
ncbi:hypothetical protein GY45DRAFT_1374991 [Cubamyces sp. BRFM 1775]|nr:hypothetical protein GY45DRAFT_1374991 [Cubamyces sp. BRFM 1775]